MSQKPEMSSAEIERLLVAMSANNTLDVELTDVELDLLLANAQAVKQAEQLTTRALLKMQEAQHKREQRLPTFALGQYLANARVAAGLTQSQVADQAAVPNNELQAFESGVWAIDQIIRQFPANVMVRILVATRVAVQDFSDELSELANAASLKLTQSSAYARSRQSSNAKSAQLIADVAEYISELQRLSS